MRQTLARFGATLSVLPARLRCASHTLEFWLTFAAYAIPLAFLLHVLYINFLPFGYSASYTIQVGAPGDTDSSKPFYLEPSRDLSDRLTDENGKPYRTLNGTATAVFNPGVVLKNAEVTVSIEGDEGISIIPPVIDFDPDSIKWDYSWDFTQGKTPKELGLIGNAFPFDGCMYFDGNSRLELPNSANKFEEGSFSVYVEWEPRSSSNKQEIIGHYNWELFQNGNTVTLQFGRMNNFQGHFYTLNYIIPEVEYFFARKHSAFFEYKPDSDTGLISLYVDNHLASAINIENNKLFPEYTINHGLSFGRSEHEKANYFSGCIRNAYIKNSVLIDAPPFSFNATSPMKIHLAGKRTSAVRGLVLHAK